MSRNFELMRAGGRSSGARALSPLSVGPSTEVAAPRIARPASPVAEEKPSDWIRALGILQKHWRLSALFGFLVMATVVAVTFLMRPVYEATARIEVDPLGEIYSLEGGSSSPSDAEYLETQSQILQSDGLALAVIRQLGLAHNPELVGKEEADISGEQSSATDARPVDGRENVALRKFHDLVKIRRDTASRLVLVTFASHDPKLAASVPNALAQAFIDHGFQTRHEAIMQSSQWLTRQLDDLRDKMDRSSQALAEFQQTVGVSEIEGDRSTYTEHMGELSRQFTQAEAERIQLEALLNNVHSSDPNSLPEVRNSPVVQQLTQRLSEHKAELSQAQVVYGPNHPTVKKLQTQVDELQSQLDGQKKAILSSLRASYAAAHAREQLMAAEMKGTTKEIGQMARYTVLKREVQTNVELYNSLYARIKEAGISAAAKGANVRIVDSARVPDTPARPRRALNIAVGMFAAIFGGLVLAFVREEFDNKLRSPEDIRKWIGRSNVSIIPVIGEGDRKAMSKFKTVGSLPGGASEENLANRFILERPNSPEAEALQALCGSIMLSWPGNQPQVLLIASGFPGEGKTTLAMNLAFALAKHARTCLVDADLRKGRIARVLGVSKGQGLSEVLTETISLDEALIEVPGSPNLSLIPAGSANGKAPHLTCSEGMRHVLESLRQNYRFVVVDSAPILPFVDGRALSTLADAVVLVGRSGMTTRQAMQRSVELISEVNGAPILQVVLNAAQLDSIDYKYYGYGYDYENQAAN